MRSPTASPRRANDREQHGAGQRSGRRRRPAPHAGAGDARASLSLRNAQCRQSCGWRGSRGWPGAGLPSVGSQGRGHTAGGRGAQLQGPRMQGRAREEDEPRRVRVTAQRGAGVGGRVAPGLSRGSRAPWLYSQVLAGAVLPADTGKHRQGHRARPPPGALAVCHLRGQQDCKGSDRRRRLSGRRAGRRDGPRGGGCDTRRPAAWTLLAGRPACWPLAGPKQEALPSRGPPAPMCTRAGRAVEPRPRRGPRGWGGRAPRASQSPTQSRDPRLRPQREGGTGGQAAPAPPAPRPPAQGHGRAESGAGLDRSPGARGSDRSRRVKRKP